MSTQRLKKCPVRTQMYGSPGLKVVNWPHRYQPVMRQTGTKMAARNARVIFMSPNAGVKRRAAFSRVRLDELLCQPQSKTQHRKLTRGRRQKATLVRRVKNGQKPPPMQKRQTRVRR